ncbi:MAG: hypothetical protein LBJ95_01270 [Oscillospiraceae bacterium]|jgi:hypothetical protein|nr:hypothetical protein [Oscillospiraceae bacterium]
MRKILSLFLAGTALLTLILTVKATDDFTRLDPDREVKILPPQNAKFVDPIYVSLIFVDTDEDFSGHSSVGKFTALNRISRPDGEF